ncbi:MAG: outer membrane beta-barrel protein [Bacteroidales bacterium]|nr:outer membrane beta-barrel protein [Bacteroidales bacterium]
MRIFYVILVLFLILPSSLFAKSINENKKERFDFGIAISANAPFVNERKMYVNWVETNKPSNETKMAGNISIFGRVNIKKHYLQIETGNSFIRDIVTLDLKDFGYSTNKYINSKNFAITLDIPIIYGYNFIKKNKYELSLFGGPKMRYTYHNRENIEKLSGISFNINEDIHPITACCLIGMSARMSRLFVDFRYEFAITVHNKPGTYSLYENNVLISEGTFYAKRGINLLSFSLGVIL